MERRGNVVTLICVDPACGNMLVAGIESKSVELLNGTAWKAIRKALPEGATNGRPVLLEILEAKCHDTSAVTAAYTKDSGKVEIFCYHCEKPIANVIV